MMDHNKCETLLINLVENTESVIQDPMDARPDIAKDYLDPRMIGSATRIANTTGWRVGNAMFLCIHMEQEISAKPFTIERKTLLIISNPVPMALGLRQISNAGLRSHTLAAATITSSGADSVLTNLESRGRL